MARSFSSRLTMHLNEKETFADGNSLDPQDSLMESSLKGSPIMTGSK